VTEHLENGQNFLLDGNLDAARAAFITALEEEPENMGARYGLARVQALSGETEEALAGYLEAIAAEPQARGLALLGVKLDGEAVSPAHRGGERHPVRRTARHVPGILGRGVVRVHEVEVRPGRDSAEGRGIADHFHFVPPHVRHLEHTSVPGRHVAGEPDHVSGEEADPLVAAELLAPGEEKLHPHADAEEWPSLVEVFPKEREQPLPDNVPHAVAERPDPGKYDPSTGGKRLRIAADEGRETEGLEGLAHAAQVPHPVVHHADRGSRRQQECPLTREPPSWRERP